MDTKGSTKFLWYHDLCADFEAAVTLSKVTTQNPESPPQKIKIKPKKYKYSSSTKAGERQFYNIKKCAFSLKLEINAVAYLVVLYYY